MKPESSPFFSSFMLLFLESNISAREILVCCSAKFLAPVYELLPRSYQHNREINARYKIKKLALRRESECSPNVFFLLNEGESYPRLSCRSDSPQGATLLKIAPNNVSQRRFATLRYYCENLRRVSSWFQQTSYPCCPKYEVQMPRVWD